MKKLRYLVASLLHARAKTYVSEKKYEKALHYLRGIYRILGGTTPSTGAMPETNMLFSLALLRIKEFPLSVAAAKMAFKQMGEIRWKYNRADRQYLRYYCRILLEKCSLELGDGGVIDDMYTDVEFSALEFDKVDARLRRNFPVRQASRFDHPVS